jgi:hypothetical protein
MTPSWLPTVLAKFDNRVGILIIADIQLNEATNRDQWMRVT